eukprot:COSAG01_NODE_7923_length_2991_cov_9.959889_3_plen_85_part_00
MKVYNYTIQITKNNREKIEFTCENVEQVVQRVNECMGFDLITSHSVYNACERPHRASKKIFGRIVHVSRTRRGAKQPDASCREE